MLVIGYRYESDLGNEVTRAVVCRDENEYNKMKQKIEEAGFELIEFDRIYKARQVLDR